MQGLLPLHARSGIAQSLVTVRFATMMSQTAQDEWLHIHIPHRIRVMIASTAELQQLRPETEPTWPDPVVKRCWTDAVWEGRLSALRWLCEFVGVSLARNGSPCRPSGRFPEDTDIQDLTNGQYVPIPSSEANMLAAAWKACTQGSVHPTHQSGHPLIDDPERTKAFAIIKAHLSTTVYSGTPDWIEKWVLTV